MEKGERYLQNIEILNVLADYINKHPDLRFIQALWAVGIINRDETGNIEDKFYEEPQVTLERVRKEIL